MPVCVSQVSAFIEDTFEPCSIENLEMSRTADELATSEKRAADQFIWVTVLEQVSSFTA